MPQPSRKTIADLIMQNIPRDLLLGIEEGLNVGAERAFSAAKSMHTGHVKHAVGQMRAFHMNETFNDALVAGGANPTPIKGNSLIVGRAGMLTLSRFNVSARTWNNGRRSAMRRQLAQANQAIEQLVQPGLFAPAPITQATVFFVASFSGSMSFEPETPQTIYIAVPDKDMKSWIFQEPLERFCSRYFEVENPVQPDTAQPKLKPGVAAETRKNQS